MKPCFAFLVNPFLVDVVNDGCPVPYPFVADAPVVEMELLELQEDEGLKMVHKSESTIEFWKKVPGSSITTTDISIFGTTYYCESLYSVLKFVKSKHRAVLTDQHLKELLRTALTT